MRAQVIGSYVGLRLAIGAVSYLIAVAWVLIGSYPREVVLGTAVLGLNLIILSGRIRDHAAVRGAPVAPGRRTRQRARSAGPVRDDDRDRGRGSRLDHVVLVVERRELARHRALADHRRPPDHEAAAHIDGRQWWIWLREAAPLALGAALDTIYFRIDVVMLAALGTYSAVGIYSVGYKFSDLLGAVPLAVITPALTMMVTAWPGDVPAFRRTFRHALIILTVGSLGACVIFVVFAAPLVSTLYTDRYADAADSARLLVVGQGLHFFTLARVHDAGGRRAQQAVSDRHARRRARERRAQLRVDPRVLVPGFGLGDGRHRGDRRSAVLAVGVLRIPGIRPLPWVAIGKCAIAATLTGLVGWALIDRIPWPVAGAIAAAGVPRAGARDPGGRARRVARAARHAP